MVGEKPNAKQPALLIDKVRVLDRNAFLSIFIEQGELTLND